MSEDVCCKHAGFPVRLQHVTGYVCCKRVGFIACLQHVMEDVCCKHFGKCDVVNTGILPIVYNTRRITCVWQRLGDFAVTKSGFSAVVRYNTLCLCRVVVHLTSPKQESARFTKL